MLTPPDRLAEAALVTALSREWDVRAAAIHYRPVGFGSHHWAVTDAMGCRWFATVDDLAARRARQAEPLSAVFGRLRASLSVAGGLSECGRDFVVAPVPTRTGGPLARLSDGFAVALYPFVEGQSFSWSDTWPQARRLAVLDLVIGTHTAPPSVRRLAMTDDFAIPHREELLAALGPSGSVAGRGPYAQPLARILAEKAAAVHGLLARYDELVLAGRSQPARWVLTHGEPHPGNAMVTSAGWRLIDWDTALVAPPERDLWMLDPGDGSVHRAYTSATRTALSRSMLELYRVRWDLTDIAIDVCRLRGPHRGSPDDDKTWNVLVALLERLTT